MTAHPWGSTDWRAEAECWARERVAALGRPATGGLTELSIQAWSAVWRLETSDGAVVLKQTTPAHRAEITVQAFCASVAPDYVDPPVALDVDGCRMLVPDGGRTLLDTRSETPETATELIKDYAQFQQATVGHHTEALAADLVSWLPSHAADELERQVDALRALPRSDLRHITAEQARHLLAKVPTFRRVGESLAASPIPYALDHGDLWIGNVLPPVAGRPHRFIDFGDAAWTHPFLSLSPFLDYYRRRSIPAAQRVIDAYLARWRDHADPAVLAADLKAAAVIAPLRRSRAAIANFDRVGREEADDLGPSPWQWLSC